MSLTTNYFIFNRYPFVLRDLRNIRQLTIRRTLPSYRHIRPLPALGRAPRVASDQTARALCIFLRLSFMYALSIYEVTTNMRIQNEVEMSVLTCARTLTRFLEPKAARLPKTNDFLKCFFL